MLHPSWRFYPNRSGGKPLVHGLNFNYLTDDEINLVRMIVDPGFQLKYFENMQKKNPNIANEFDRIIARAGAANITSPQDFYLRAVKPFIQPRGWDPYRLYDPLKMENIRILQTQKQMLGESKMPFFGMNQNNGAGKDEKQIVSDLAMKKSQEEKTGIKQLSPSENKFIHKLQGAAQRLFNNYKNKFQNARGPSMDNRAPNFGRKLPSFMDDDLSK